MGGKDSKLSYISYEEALKRVTDAELKRLKDAFRRSSNLNGYMTESLFIREVLWDGVPSKVAQLLCMAFGGTQKGLSFKDLMCGLVVLTKGTREEKIKLIFGMYSDDSFSYIQKDEMDRRIIATEEQVSSDIAELFRESDQVSFEQFYTWVVQHPEATIVTRWLLMHPIAFSLSSDIETPTFYQTLAGVTHLEETDISELEKRYWVLKAQSKSGRFDQETFKSFVSPPIPHTLCEALFMAFDENRDNHIDFKEMACGISACCRGPMLERQKFCFKIFDADHDGLLSHSELQEMIDALVAIRLENKDLDELEGDAFIKMDPATVAKEIIITHDSDKDGKITQEEYLVWTVNNALSEDFLDLLSQVCHIVLGLKPQTREEEGRIINNWLDREGRKPKQIGQIWYLISIQWWKAWIEYVNFKIPETNGSLPPSGRSSRSNSNESNSRHRIVTGRNKAYSDNLPWDNETVVIVNTVRKNSIPTVDLSMNGSNSMKFNTVPRTSNSATSSPRKYNLAPLDSVASERSPSPSPKLRKKHIIISAPQKPGAIDNNQLILSNPQKVVTLTNEGGRLRRDTMLVWQKDFELVPEPVWRALSAWYGGGPAIPRTVIPGTQGDPSPELELYPVMVRLLRHQVAPARPAQTTAFTNVVSGISGMALSTVTSFSNNSQPRRYLAYVASFSKCHTLQQVYDFLCTKLRFSREDIRLWKISSKDEQNITLLDDESFTVEQSGIEDNQQLLIEVRNKDLTWPEEMSQLAKNKTLNNKKDQGPTNPGATGLNNLGNTCFMNAALQCVSNTWPLTQYFTGGLHLYELNRVNPLGMKGHIAQRYGELVKDMWSGSSKTIAPLKLRWTIGKYAPRFNGFQQHDSQELLSFLLDGLHEDLNRVHDKPYIELKDSDGRPDEIVAQEAWENHLLRNKSIVVDLFHGQLKSQVRCKECGHISVRFDPFNYLSLPLPMDSCIHLEIIAIKLNGSVPVKYGLRLNMDAKYKALKKELCELTNIPTNQILLVEVLGPIVKTLPQDNQKIRTLMGGVLYAYELPPPSEIEPITVEEEKLQQKTIGLNEIQRGLSIKKSTAASPSNNGMQANGVPPQLLSSDGNDANSSSNASTPTHSRQPSIVGVNGIGSPEMNGSSTPSQKSVDLFNGFIIGVHRKMTLMDLYFLSSQKTRPSLFGTPIILPCDENTTNQELYQFIWCQVARLVSPLPPSEAKANHALDCDDSLGYEYPFTLKTVQKDGFACARCPWFRFCRGCKIDCNSDLFEFDSSFIAIDWEPTALHLRYQTTNERFYEEHKSVAESVRKQTEPIDLDTCLQAFTKEEELGEDELYFCSKCKKHCLASKKLDIWRLPPVLIINLKRFQFVNGRWVKSHKIVKFPVEHFDPSCYLVKKNVNDIMSLSLCKSDSIPIFMDSFNHGDSPKVPNMNGNFTADHCDKKEGAEFVSPTRRKEDSDKSSKQNSKLEHTECCVHSSADDSNECHTNYKYNLYAMS
ncbi:hypothetical protein ACJMK2_012103, partial [Sinanodonta woodiana]